MLRQGQTHVEVAGTKLTLLVSGDDSWICGDGTGSDAGTGEGNDAGTGAFSLSRGSLGATEGPSTV